MLPQELPMEEQPDVMLESQPMPTPGSQGGSQRAASEPPPSSGGGQPGVAAAAAAAEQAREKEEGEEEGEGELDPPYVRYLEPTPDDLDLSVEYDVDEEDEEWLEVFNERVRACMCGCSGDGAAPEPCGAAWAHVCATPGERSAPAAAASVWHTALLVVRACGGAAARPGARTAVLE